MKRVCVLQQSMQSEVHISWKDSRQRIHDCELTARCELLLRLPPLLPKSSRQPVQILRKTKKHPRIPIATLTLDNFEFTTGTI